MTLHLCYITAYMHLVYQGSLLANNKLTLHGLDGKRFSERTRVKGRRAPYLYEHFSEAFLLRHRGHLRCSFITAILSNSLFSTCYKMVFPQLRRVCVWKEERRSERDDLTCENRRGEFVDASVWRTLLYVSSGGTWWTWG